MAIREDILKVALAGLLHDLGKVYQRAGIVYNNNGEENTQEEEKNNEFKYPHVEITYWLASHHHKEDYIDRGRLSNIQTEDDERKFRNMLNSIVIGDRLSSEERLSDEIALKYMKPEERKEFNKLSDSEKRRKKEELKKYIQEQLLNNPKNINLNRNYLYLVFNYIFRERLLGIIDDDYLLGNL